MILHFLGWGYLRNSKEREHKKVTKSSSFQFKKFMVRQEKAAMKVGTDGILLGAWANLLEPCRILDLGTGTGLIALMLAQRTQEAKIIAIDIEEAAAKEAAANVANSPWQQRIEVKHISFQNFAKKNATPFDLIVSNPPFFTKSLQAKCSNRTLARHNNALPFQDLFYFSAKLLSQKGRLALVLPLEALAEIEDIVLKTELYLIRKTIVSPNAKKQANRVLVEFSKEKSTLENDFLTIYNATKHEYSDGFKLLTKAFYLKH